MITTVTLMMMIMMTLSVTVMAIIIPVVDPVDGVMVLARMMMCLSLPEPTLNEMRMWLLRMGLCAGVIKC